MTEYVLLPVTQETFNEIAEEVVVRGHADRMRGATMIKLTDVVLVVDPDKKMAPTRPRKRR